MLHVKQIFHDLFKIWHFESFLQQMRTTSLSDALFRRLTSAYFILDLLLHENLIFV